MPCSRMRMAHARPRLLRAATHRTRQPSVRLPHAAPHQSLLSAAEPYNRRVEACHGRAPVSPSVGKSSTPAHTWPA
eukprot:1135411-Prymnesium_polylepis.2